MKLSFTLLTILLISSLKIFASSEDSLKMDWKKVSVTEVSMKSHPDYPEASSVILFDKGELTFGLSSSSDNLIKLILTRHKRIKIFEDQPIKNLKIPYPKKGVVTSIKVRIYNLTNDNKIKATRVKRKDIATDNSNTLKNKTGEYLYQSNTDSTKNFKIVYLPDLQKGSVYEYTYTLVFNDFESLYEWQFQNKVPTMTSQFLVKTPHFYEYQHLLYGEHQLDSFDVKNEIETIRANVAAANAAAMVTPANQNILNNTGLSTNPLPIRPHSTLRFQQLLEYQNKFFRMRNIAPIKKGQDKSSIARVNFSLERYSNVNPKGINSDEQWLYFINRSRGVLLSSRRYYYRGVNRMNLNPSSLMKDFKSRPMRAVFPGEINQLDIGEDLPTGTGSWQDINTILMANVNFGVQLRTNKKTAKLIKDHIDDSESDKDKMINIYKHIQRQMRWNEKHALFAENKLNKVYQKGNGNSAEINLLLTLMLRYAGLDAAPVIISTQENGPLIKSYPDLRKLNSVIVAVNIDSTEYLLDATDKLRGYNLLDAQDINDYGWKVEVPEKAGWVDIKVDRSSQTAIADMVINRQGNLEGEINYYQNNFIALKKRREIYRKQLADKLEAIFEARMNDANIKSSAFLNLIDFEKPLVSSYKFTTLDFVKKGNNTLTISPMMMERMKSNPFRPDSISDPISFLYPQEYRYIINLIIPDNYEIVSYPQEDSFTFEKELSGFQRNINKDPKVAKFDYKARLVGKKLTISMLIQSFTNEIFPNEYENLKAFYQQIIEKHKEKIVLRKKE